MEQPTRSRSPSLENPLTADITPKQPGKKPRAPITDKQKEALKKGMEALKKKREEIAKEKESREKSNAVLREKGLPPIEPPPKLKKKDVVPLPPVEKVEIAVPPPRKVRKDKGVPKGTPAQPKADKLEELKTMVRDLHTRTTPQVAEPVVKEVVKEVPVEKVVVKEVVKEISGSALLQRIFFEKN